MVMLAGAGQPCIVALDVRMCGGAVEIALGGGEVVPITARRTVRLVFHERAHMAPVASVAPEVSFSTPDGCGDFAASAGPHADASFSLVAATLWSQAPLSAKA